MNYKTTTKLAKYIELNILPNIIAYTLADLYKNNNLKEISFIKYVNNIRKIINITNINYKVIKKITINQLNNKYHLEVINLYPLKIKELDN
ncbi:MAG TPA: hypothetical protein PLB45_00275 [Bacilli bacterium]|nr:hypothetical protein [Bacilli bacterium]HPZ23280.1 hypothetical protein [Bacilli bacterium]HQC83297.1 hypothetical protein [Bacilli bacterium]